MPSRKYSTRTKRSSYKSGRRSRSNRDANNYYGSRKSYNRYLRGRNVAISGVMGAEKKWRDYNNFDVPINKSVTYANCNIEPYGTPTQPAVGGVNQGVGATERIGSQIYMVSMEWEIVLHKKSESEGFPATLPFAIFVAIYCDTQTNSDSTDNGNLVFANQAATAEGNLCPLRKLQYGKRFKVYKKWVIVPQAADALYQNSPSYLVQPGGNIKLSYYKKFKKPFKIVYNNTGDELGAITNHSFHLMANLNQNNTDWLCTYNCRIRFYDA